jgi:hypothetical protein
MRIGIRPAIGTICAAAVAFAAWASWDGGEPPEWALVKPAYDPGGSAAMLLPSNDTRVNLYLLLADRRGAVIRDPQAKGEVLPLILFPWDVMARAAQHANEQGNDGYAAGTRCDSDQSGTTSFVEAVRASPRIPAPDKAQLIAARQALDPRNRSVEQYVDVTCGKPDMSQHPLTGIGSPAGREFVRYLDGAAAFYAGEFDDASIDFSALASAANPWVRETALYMVARAKLNGAQQFDQYGDLVELAKRDRAAIVAAGTAFDAYLKTYPDGRYASSARGLKRRVAWLAGDESALASEYGRQLEAKRLDGAPSHVDLVNEIDNKLPLPTNGPQTVRDPILLAVVDLHRMRQPSSGADRGSCCGPAITRSEIEGQRPLFGNDTELFDYVRAAEAYFVRHQPREVVQLIPDAVHQTCFSYLQFSRQMLRGMALQDLGDRNARGFWLSLFPGATQPYQRGALELALAMHDEKSGRLDLVFAPDSKVRHPIIRQLLLERVAGPGILRQQASRPDVPKFEREVALYMLLSKELRRGFYREFLGDVRLLPADPVDDYFAGAENYDADINAELTRPPLARFGSAAKLGDAGCPVLTATVAQLAQNPRAVRPRLCLAEFFRDSGFDDFGNWYDFDKPVAGNGLASTRPQFPAATPYSRLEVYKSIMADSAASPNDQAWALNRAVRCYAPSGNNSCGGTEVALAVRRGWFNRLKAQYPQSAWARDLQFYW